MVDVLCSAACSLAVLLTVPLDGQPVRFGVPLPTAALARGLRLDGRGALQWRRLPVAVDGDLAWVELAIVGPRGMVRVLAGGSGPDDDRDGAAFAYERTVAATPAGQELRERWLWRDGVVDERRRLQHRGELTGGADAPRAGEATTVVSAQFDERALAWCRLPTARLVDAGLLPPPGGGGDAARALRRHLASTLPSLRELPGPRGAGDYGRSGGVVTNLEFDTTFALLRCGIGLRDESALRKALRSGRHLVDCDLDGASGLPYPHGLDHRSGTPEPGHAWLQGVLWLALLTADDELVAAAQGLGLALALHPPRGAGATDRMRDLAWPLLELEALLRWWPDVRCAQAADRCAAAIAGRWDAGRRRFHFGEDATADGGVLERGWLASGLLLPALRAHLRRRPAATLASCVDAMERRIQAVVASRGDGVPTHWRLDQAGAAYALHRESATAGACFALEGLPRRELGEVLARSAVRRATANVPSPDDPDLPTAFTLVARCDWVWR
ncbi:MAG: hypothetical protein INH34_11790 [Phycisphaerales bacterium]|jgi:hypothetical protein|nr:hypothetical protein [Phycisphaerales bacterium]